MSKIGTPQTCFWKSLFCLCLFLHKKKTLQNKNLHLEKTQVQKPTSVLRDEGLWSKRTSFFVLQKKGHKGEWHSDA